MNIGITTEAVETCPHCESENVYENWDPFTKGYIAKCKGCGREIFLCDECLHMDDNPAQECNWHEESRDGEIWSCCFRGEYKTDEKEFYYITVYADNTGWYTEEELIKSNMVDIKVPRKLAYEWYYNNSDLKETTKRELPRSECTFEDWLYKVSDCDQTDSLFQWLLDHGFTPRKEDAIR